MGIGKIYKYDKFDKPSPKGSTTNYTALLDIDTCTGGCFTAVDTTIEKSRDAQTSIEVRGRVQVTWLKEDQLIHLFTLIYEH